jgi:hypothetical protein
MTEELICEDGRSWSSGEGSSANLKKSLVSKTCIFEWKSLGRMATNTSESMSKSDTCREELNTD